MIASIHLWTAEQERAAVVAWLRRAPALRHYAGCIERGEHRRDYSSLPAK
jgi:hypothetical protein